jgi:hypothetical protein
LVSIELWWKSSLNQPFVCIDARQTSQYVRIQLDAGAACYMGEFGPMHFFADIQKEHVLPWEAAV